MQPLYFADLLHEGEKKPKTNQKSSILNVMSGGVKSISISSRGSTEDSGGLQDSIQWLHQPLSDPYFAPPLTLPFKQSSVRAMYTGLTKIIKGN